MKNKEAKIKDLEEQIDKLDEMIKLHSNNPSDFMLLQYQARRENLLEELNKMKTNINEKMIPLKDAQKLEDCMRSFIRANHLSKLWDEHWIKWEENAGKMPPSSFDR
jgi:SMC interacting uncharacterized protein involved in chromosome segregation